VRLAYDNADSLTRWWLDKYVDLSAEQDALARERLMRLHARHRKTQLPAYLAVLRQGQQFVAGEPAAADALAIGDSLIRHGRTLADLAIPDVADFLPTLSEAQIGRMAARIAEKNAEYAEEVQLADGESGQRQARYKRLLERTEYWFGDFAGAQRAALRRLIDAQASGSQFAYDERLRRQHDWLALVRQVQRERPARERVIQLLQDYAAHFDLPDDAARLAQAAALRRASAELAVAILAITSPAQRTHARNKLGELIQNFTEMSQQG
jgi:hypothetical protein